MKKVIIIGGPTAIGKTGVSIDLAKRINGEIVSADSMQIYKNMMIGTARVTKEEMDGIPHYLVGVIDPKEEYSVSMYRRDALAAIEDIHSRGKLPIVVGGTGLYLNALMYEMDFAKKISDDDLRKKYQRIADEKGAEYLHHILCEMDCDAAYNIHPNNVKKVIRAIEINVLTGKNMKNFSSDPVKNSKYEFVLTALTMSRAKLYAQINRRVDIMLENGLIDEVKKLKKDGLNVSYQSMQGIGYKEVFDYLVGEYSFDEMVSKIKLNSRRYAKRQLTWLRRYHDLRCINVDKFDSLSAISDYLYAYIGGNDENSN